MTKITSLTPEQKARFPEFIKKWTDIGLCTKPADRPRAEKAITALYDLAKLKEPKIVWLPCPISAGLSAVYYTALLNVVEVNKKTKTKSTASVPDIISAIIKRKDINDNIVKEVGLAVEKALVGVDTSVLPDNKTIVKTISDNDKIKQAIRNAGVAYFGGSLWNAGYCSWVDYFNEVCGVKIDRNFLDVTESCGFYWVLDGICFASERPSEINFDEERRLHSETGMSISYKGSGWGLFHWHGTQVPGEWILHKEKLTAKIALTQTNIEQRRAACEIVGWSKILHDLGARTIDRDNDPQIGELVAVKLPDLPNDVKFLRVRCGTGRDFAICVPPNIEKVLDAQAWVTGLDPKDYSTPEVRA